MKIAMKRVLLPLAAGLFFLGAAASAALPGREPEIMEISVQENETLWDIAVRNSDDSVDVRAYLYEIRQLNGITDSSLLQPGQLIKVPVMNGK